MSSSFGPSGNQEPQSRTSYRDWIHDVFVSFTKEDNIHEFVSDLYAALRTAGVRVFKDQMEPRSGDQILFKAIEESRVSIIVFSRNYADSTWCLQELEKIMECRSIKGQGVVPVFYGVDPSEVCNQTGHFGESLARIEGGNSTNKNKVLGYRNALKEVAGLSGFAIDFRNLSEASKNIIDHVITFLDSTDLFIEDHLVGLQSRVQDLIQLLNYHESNDVLLLGIVGMGGSGKTTIAKAVYNQISRNFEGRKFLNAIRNRWKNESKVSLQEELISCIYKRTTAKIHDIESGKLILKERLCCKRVFIVLDDVSELDQLKALCPSREWFGTGSRIIITTRDKHLLDMLRVDDVYTVKLMDYNESVEQFCWHAFKKATPDRNFVGLTERVLEYANGLPLAIQVLGSFLKGRTIEEWSGALERLARDPRNSIQTTLKSGFDELEDTEKEIFLDIACFFVGEDQNVIQILNSCRQNVEIGIRVLEEKSYLSVDEDNKLQMHDLLQKMGRQIVREGSQNKSKPSAYDVFLSFQGEDTRVTFTSHLHTSLENAGISVFKDDIALPRGERISISLLNAIAESRISIIVLSTNYANSSWCLQELENIMVCYSTKAQVVVPIFYHVDPSEVRYQKGLFGQAFENLLKRIPVKKDRAMLENITS